MNRTGQPQFPALSFAGPFPGSAGEVTFPNTEAAPTSGWPCPVPCSRSRMLFTGVLPTPHSQHLSSLGQLPQHLAAASSAQPHHEACWGQRGFETKWSTGFLELLLGLVSPAHRMLCACSGSAAVASHHAPVRISFRGTRDSLPIVGCRLSPDSAAESLSVSAALAVCTVPWDGTAGLSFGLQLPRCPQQVPVLQAPRARPAEAASSQPRCRQRWHLLASSPSCSCSSTVSNVPRVGLHENSAGLGDRVGHNLG